VLEFEVLEHAESKIGVLILRRRNPPEDHVIELTLEAQFLMSNVVTFSECALATRAIEMHGGSNLDVLVGGLGLGYTNKAALESDRVAKLECVELVAGVISWFERGIIPLGKELMADPRLSVVEDDVYQRLLKPPVKTHDLILIDVDHSPDSQLGQSNDIIYDRQGLTLAKQHLSPGGVFGVWSFEPSPRFETELREIFDEVRIHTVEFHNPTTGDDEINWIFLAR